MLNRFPEHPKKLVDATLTSFYSILHRQQSGTGPPSSNSTVVTRFQVPVLFAIGTVRHFNFGKLVFDVVLQFADGARKGIKLPVPSLIYEIMLSQRFF